MKNINDKNENFISDQEKDLLTNNTEIENIEDKEIQSSHASQENNFNNINNLTPDKLEQQYFHDNKLLNKFSEKIRLDMTNLEIIKFIFLNTFFCIVSKILVSINDSLTVSFLGHLKGYQLTPFFIANLIQNIGFKGIGFGFTTTSGMLASRYFGQRSLYEVGQTINRGKIILFFFSIICLIISIFGKPFFSLLFPDVNNDLVITYLIHSSLSLFFVFQTTMQLTYLNSHNNFIYSALIDTLTTLTQFIIFKIIFTFYREEIESSSENTYIITAWCLNLTYFLSYVYYTFFIHFYKPSPETNLKFNRDSFRIGNFLYLSLHFIFFFVSHFLGGEQLNILINNYYGKKTVYFDTFTISQKVYFLLQKITMGFSFFIMNLTGSLVTKGEKFKILLKKITKIFLLISFGVIVLSIGLMEILANQISYFFTDKQEILEYLPGYIRIISLIAIPYHLEVMLQAILTGHNKQKYPAFFSIIVTVLGGLGFGFLFIYGMDLGVNGIFYTMFILEILFSIVNFICVLKINSGRRGDVPVTAVVSLIK
jgi:Na+-driven multidrug efflux pump